MNDLLLKHDIFSSTCFCVPDGSEALSISAHFFLDFANLFPENEECPGTFGKMHGTAPGLSAFEPRFKRKICNKF